jgi:hypothetical protein
MADGFGHALRIRLPFFIPSGSLSPTAKVIFRFSSDSLRKHILALKSWSSGPNALANPEISRIFPILPLGLYMEHKFLAAFTAVV